MRQAGRRSADQHDTGRTANKPLNPALVEAYRLETLGRLAEAEAGYRAVVAADPGDGLALHQLALAHYRRGDTAGALAMMTRAVEMRPDAPECVANLGMIFAALGAHDRSLAACDAALALQADHLPALYNRANALAHLGRYDEALASYQAVLLRAPERLDALYGCANALRELGRPEESLATYESILTRNPDHADAALNAALTKLRLGDFSGWRGYEARWRAPAHAHLRRDFAAPPWLGDAPLDGKTVLLHAEQGQGDTIQFARYVPLVAARGARVILEVQPSLVALMRSLAGADTVIARGTALPDFDLHCPLMSLPLAFATELATIPAAVPYLAPPTERLAVWRAQLPPRRPRVGLVWSGNPAYSDDTRRSVPFALIATLLQADAAFVSLQRDVRAEEQVALSGEPRLLPLADGFADFADTAAVIDGLDLVISVDTAVAHLAGALGKRVWIMLPFSPDFRWLLQRADSPWYPSARLFRQPTRGDWSAVVTALRRELEAWPG